MLFNQQICQPSLPKKCAGVATVEFAILIFILLLVVAGIFEFGRALWYYDALAKATRDSARFLSMSSPMDTGAAKNMVDQARIAANLPDFDKDANVAITCTPDCNDPEYVTVGIVGYTVTIGSILPLAWSPGQSVSYDVMLSPRTTMHYAEGG